jgi:two-component system chemotaxis sensor kinase CheA
MTDGMDEIIGEFLVESREHLDRLDSDLVSLEQGGDPELIAAVFRSVHTIKGTAGFLGFARLEALAHAGEDLLGALRDARIAITPEVITPLLEMLDALRALLGTIEASGADDAEVGDLAALAAQLRAPLAPSAKSTPAPAEPTPQVDDAPVAEPVGEPVAEAATSVADAAPQPAVPPAVPPAVTPPAREKKPADAGSPLRVDVSLLDRLMNLVGELVLVRNHILQLTETIDTPELASAAQRLNHITSELQEGVTHARMQPIGNVWAKLPRLVRDVSRACGKTVEIVTEGAETELDKTILEAISDPLTHLVRNAIDHGIEPPAKRLAAGKTEAGTVKLRAYHEGGVVTIELSDDGNGIDPAAISRKAVASGLLSQERALAASDAEIVELIFHPGFSTAEKITNVSGRGVGMDVVRSSISAIGGTVSVESRLGEGTTFRVKIPLTLAIIPALIVAQGQARYAIPQVNLLELVRVEPNEVEWMPQAPVYRLRGQLLPLVYLSEALGVEPSADASYVLVLQAGATRFGLVVDEVRDTAEIVVKPLTSLLQGISAFSGATVMGDGHVALILDAVGLAEGIDAHADAATAEQAAVAAADDLESFLIAQVGADRRVAIPLAEIDRIEVFPLEAIERAGSTEVVQYRGAPMPLHRLSGFLGEYDVDSDGLHAIVCNPERPVGVVITRILDVTTASRAVLHNRQVTDSFVSGRGVLNGRVTDVVDLSSVLAMVAE